MAEGLIDIEIHASRLGKEMTIASYYSMAVPRVGESILLRLHAGYYTKPDGQASGGEARFLVHGVLHVAFNHSKTEPWFEPWTGDKVSNYVVIDAIPSDDAARDYLERLASVEWQS